MIIAQVVKDDYAKPYGTWVRVTEEQYRRWGPAGAGQLRRPTKDLPHGAEIVDMQEGDDSKDLEKFYYATPSAVELAKEHGIDLKTVDGSGPLGKIYKTDVQKVIGER